MQYSQTAVLLGRHPSGCLSWHLPHLGPRSPGSLYKSLTAGICKHLIASALQWQCLTLICCCCTGAVAAAWLLVSPFWGCTLGLLYSLTRGSWSYVPFIMEDGGRRSPRCPRSGPPIWMSDRNRASSWAQGLHVSLKARLKHIVVSTVLHRFKS